MIYTTNKFEQRTKKLPQTPLIGVSLLVICVIVLVSYWNASNVTDETDISKSSNLLIKKLDGLIASIESKIATRSVNREKEVEILSINKLILQGIIWNPQEPLAIIDNRIVAEGDIIKGIKITDLEETSVTLEDKQGRKRILYFYENK